MSKILITGGAGFIGSHLAEQLLGAGHRVVALDDLSTGAAANLADLQGHPGFEFVHGCAKDRRLLARLLDDVDQVYHLAAAVGVHRIVEQPVRTIDTNIAATEAVLEACARTRCPVLLASTSEVYGKLDAERFAEDDDLVLGPTTRSRWCYASSKIIDEFLALAYYQEQGLPVVIVRLFNTIGPRQTGRYGMVVPRLVTQALRGEALTVYGDGTQRRSFTWVGDVVKALPALMGRPSAMGEVFNLGHHEDISILELARTVLRLTGSDSPIEFIPYARALGSGFEDMPRRLPRLDKIEACIGYRPTRKLHDMLTEIIAATRAQRPQLETRGNRR